MVVVTVVGGGAVVVDAVIILRFNLRQQTKNCLGKSGGHHLFQQNKARYTAQDAPSMRTFHLRKKHGTDGRTVGPTDGHDLL